MTGEDRENEVRNILTNSLKRTRSLFLSNENQLIPEHMESQKLKISSKILVEYANLEERVKEIKELQEKTQLQQQQVKSSSIVEEPNASTTIEPTKTMSTVSLSSTPENSVDESASTVDRVVEELKQTKQKKNIKPNVSTGIVEYKQQTEASRFGSTSIVRRMRTDIPKPQWHAPWKMKRVIAGHLGWVRAIAVDPTNQWFATGSADRTIKIWDLASGQLRLTLTGHINCVRGIAVSSRHPYMFSAGEDKMVKCWDLEYNKVIRSYHGHLSGVYCLKLHPTLDILITGGRDSVGRVWDMRTKAQIHVLSGHQGTVGSILTQGTDPQVITGSYDNTIKLWDLAAGKVMTTLTHHKKGIRSLAANLKEHSFVSGAADNLKKWHAKDGKFLRNYSGHNAIINSVVVNEDDVLMSGGDNGTMHFWDYATGYCFQKQETIVQPGSLDSEAGIYAAEFDMTGMRLIVGEADKTIKIWQEDDTATEETHPIDMKEWIKQCTVPKRY